MTNPQQQHDSGSNIDPLASGRLPPLNARRPSYASVVSGSPSSLARPTRSGGFSHLLNPSPDSEQQQGQSSDPYSTTQDPRFETGMSYTHNGGLGGEELPARDDAGEAIVGGLWAPRLGATFPYFSRAFDLYVNKDPLLASDPAGPDDARFPSTSTTPNVSPTGFLSPSYLRGSIYLQKLEEQHRAKILAEREGPNPNTPLPVGTRILTDGRSPQPLPTNVDLKAVGSTHRGVMFEVVENPFVRRPQEDTVSPLPSRWNRDDKEAALEVLGDGYEVRHTGRALSDHEASAIRADHYMSPACGVYYFEITVLNGRHDKIK